MEINKYYDIIAEKLTGWLELLVKMLPNFVVAVLVLIAFIFAGRLVRNISDKLLDKAIKNKSLSSIISKVIYIIVVTIGLFTALSFLNLDKTVSSLVWPWVLLFKTSLPILLLGFSWPLNVHLKLDK